jgi:transposase-like protein
MKAGAMAALLAGQSVTRVAEQYSIPRGTVGRWSSELRRTGETFETKKEKAAIGELLMEYVSENLRTLREQTVIFRDSEWVEQQNAAEMAVLHGVLADKTIRILEALEPSEGT